MSSEAQSIPAPNTKSSKLVERSTKLWTRVPVVGRVPMPPPEQLAFYGGLGALAAFSLINWPVAVVIGVGETVVARQLGKRPTAQPEQTSPPDGQAKPTSNSAGETTAPRTGAKSGDQTPTATSGR
ncbi:hypothetical protein [Mycobacterium avium]|uniref:hypothetical protein n=1 Tax=Mycobacterium avium TaxID=1764 RepID=UPI00111C1752|nr:hypothetical protein [Mycobacterium avium]